MESEDVVEQNQEAWHSTFSFCFWASGTVTIAPTSASILPPKFVTCNFISLGPTWVLSSCSCACLFICHPNVTAGYAKPRVFVNSCTCLSACRSFLLGSFHCPSAGAFIQLYGKRKGRKKRKKKIKWKRLDLFSFLFFFFWVPVDWSMDYCLFTFILFSLFWHGQDGFFFFVFIYFCSFSCLEKSCSYALSPSFDQACPTIKKIDVQRKDPLVREKKQRNAIKKKKRSK